MKFYRLQRIRADIVNAGYLRKPVLGFLRIILHLKKKILNVKQNAVAPGTLDVLKTICAINELETFALGVGTAWL